MVMPRKILIRTADYPYHITSRSNNREFFYIDKPILWEIFMDCLKELKFQYHCEIHAFVLMSNHYHMLISTPKENIGEAMKYFHREVARNANRNAGRVNHFFGGRYKWSLIHDEHYFWNCLKYIFRNPVRAGLTREVQNYKYSSLTRKPKKFSWALADIYRKGNPLIELDLAWLNEPFLLEGEAAIQKALRRREFQLPRNESCRIQELEAARFKKGTVTLGGSF